MVGIQKYRDRDLGRIRSEADRGWKIADDSARIFVPGRRGMTKLGQIGRSDFRNWVSVRSEIWSGDETGCDNADGGEMAYSVGL